MSIANYHPLRLHPYRWRSEHINIGIVVFREDGVRVHIADNLKKIRTFAPSVNIEAVRGWSIELQDLLIGAKNHNESVKIISQWGSVRQIGEQQGRFLWSSEREYAERVAGVLQRLVEPEYKQRSPAEHIISSRLNKELRNAFSNYGWLGKTPEDINHHIVPRYLLDDTTGLRADFAVKNGRMHVIETVDFRVADPLSKRESTQAKTLVLALAKDAERYAIIAGGEGKDIAPSINLLTAHADHVIRWEDTIAVDKFLGIMSRVTGKPLIDMPIG